MTFTATGMRLAVGREPWRRDAACLGADPWLFDGDDDADTLKALGYCRACPVVAPCAEWAKMDRKFSGVAGGRVWTRDRTETPPGAKGSFAEPR